MLKRSIQLLAVALAVCVLHARTQAESVEFGRNLSAGDSFTFDGSQVIDLETDIFMGQMKVQSVNQQIIQKRAGRVEVLEAEGGKPTSVRVTYDEGSGSSIEATGQGKQEKPFPFAGKSAVISKKADGSLDLNTDVQTEDVEAIGELRALLDRDEGMYPDGPVEVGDTWDAGKEAVAKSFNLGPDDQGRGSFKLVDVKEVDGRQAAEVDATIEVNKTDQTGTLTLKMDGTMLIDVVTGEVLDSQLSGPVTHELEQTMEQEGQPVKLKMVSKGKGTLKNTGTVGGDGGGVRRDPVRKPPTRDGGDNPLARKKKQPAADAPFAAVFENSEMRLALQQRGADVSGSLFLGQDEYPVQAVAKGNYLIGKFGPEGEAFEFTAELDGSTLKFETEGTTYELQRAGSAKKENPLKRN